MWDDEYNKDNVTSRVPCGKKISYWLARAFTLSNIKKYADKSQYALAMYYKDSLPNTEVTLKELQDFYLNQIKLLKKILKNNPISAFLDLSTFINPTNITVSVMPCPPVLMFVRINILCDEAHGELRKLYQFGNITKSEYFRQRRELFKPINRFRSEFASSVSEAGKLARSLTEKNTGEPLVGNKKRD
ncbi:hypothetical protein [Xenorhabdus bovienii]|nr:hypothetical protein [Xenorhabdus bovienii]